MTREMLTTVAGLTAAAGLLIAGAQTAASSGPTQQSPALAAALATLSSISISAMAPRMNEVLPSEDCDSCGGSGVCGSCHGDGIEHGCGSCRSPVSPYSTGACQDCENEPKRAL
jgi:hypothetical protein